LLFDHCDIPRINLRPESFLHLDSCHMISSVSQWRRLRVSGRLNRRHHAARIIPSPRGAHLAANLPRVLPIGRSDL
jgi:hypothetical protein